MKNLYCLLPLFAVNCLFAQNSQQYYSGIFLNEKEKPQNFLKVLNKNSGVYELTDEKGFAIIAAKNYDTLVWNNGKNKAVVYGTSELKTILESQIEKRSVQNIQNNTYDSLISKERKDEFSIENSGQSLRTNLFDYYSVRKIKEIGKNYISLKGRTQKFLFLNGSFTTSAEVKSRNSVAKTQNQYVQGRSENGELKVLKPMKCSVSDRIFRL